MLHLSAVESDSGTYLPLVVLCLSLELNVPVCGVDLGTVGNCHCDREGEVEPRGTVCHLWRQENFIALRCLHTNTGGGGEAQ